MKIGAWSPGEHRIHRRSSIQDTNMGGTKNGQKVYIEPQI